MIYPLVIVLTMMQVVPTSTLIDCRTACSRCEEQDDTSELLEVYCSMCDECMERRQEWLRNDDLHRRPQTEATTYSTMNPCIESKYFHMAHIKVR